MFLCVSQPGEAALQFAKQIESGLHPRRLVSLLTTSMRWAVSPLCDCRRHGPISLRYQRKRPLAHILSSKNGCLINVLPKTTLTNTGIHNLHRNSQKCWAALSRIVGYAGYASFFPLLFFLLELKANE